MRKILSIAAMAVLLFSCSQKADLLIYNARVYTVDSAFSIAEAIAIKNGKIAAVGTTKDLSDKYDAAEKVDAGGKFIYPGLIDAHAHFYRYGLGLQTADLVDTKSWEEIISRLQSFAQQNAEGWLIGRGWDQNDWAIKEYPNRNRLDSLFPDRPVLLTRVDGHAAVANGKALELAGMRTGMKVT